MSLSRDMTYSKMTCEEFQIYHMHELEALFAMLDEKLGGHSNLNDFVDFCYANTSLERPKDFREAMTEFYEFESSD